MKNKIFLNISAIDIIEVSFDFHTLSKCKMDFAIFCNKGETKETFKGFNLKQVEINAISNSKESSIIEVKNQLKIDFTEI